MGEFAVALNIDETCILEFFEVVGDGRRSEIQPVANAGAGGSLLGFRDFLEHFEAAGIGQGLADECDLPRIDLGLPGHASTAMISRAAGIEMRRTNEETSAQSG